MTSTNEATITKIRLWMSNHFAGHQYVAVFSDGRAWNLECRELQDVPWAYAIRMFGRKDLAEMVAKFSPAVLPGLGVLHPVGYEFDFADLADLVPAPVPVPKKVKLVRSGPFDDDIRSLEGNEDL